MLPALPTIIQRLKAAYPQARYELNWGNPLQLLVATILAAQCTDERVNQVTPALFAKYPTAQDYAEADLAELEEAVRPTGFYRQKAKTIRNACKELVVHFQGEVPRTTAELTTLPGVARKTANVVLNNAFGVASGVIVDTHVARVSQRLGLTEQAKPEQIEQDLMHSVPQDEWIHFGAALVLHGRYTCTAQHPHCSECILNDLCPKRGLDEQTNSLSFSQLPTPPAQTGSAADDDAHAGATPMKKAKPATVKPAALDLPAQLPPSWQAVMAGEFQKPYFQKLQEFVAAERQTHTVFPPEEDVFNAFKFTPYEQVKVLLLGQDPYHDDGQAHGLCFSVRPGIKPPPSLVNMFKELHNDLGCRIPDNGHLTPWAKQGSCCSTPY
jgi:endonuclease-3